MWWVLPLILGAMLWAAADTISDAVITDHTHIPNRSVDDEEKVLDIDKAKKDVRLSGEQDAAVSFGVMGVLGIILHSISPTEKSLLHVHNEVVMLALLAGCFQCVSLIFLLKAFENSSSTVIVPLMQLNAVFVLPLSILMTLMSTRFQFLSSHHKIIQPLHLLAFTLIFCGGFYPACDGNISRFFDKAFWRQKAVVQVIISDITIAIYYVLVSACTADSAGMTSSAFMVLSIWGNILLFVALVLVIPVFRNSVLNMVAIDSKYILLSALGEVLSIAGYYVISFSYHWYYNSGIVSAAEGSLNQLFNLILAILFKKYLNFGRKVDNIKSKLLSCLLVTSGLVLASV